MYSNANARLLGTNVVSQNATEGITVGLGGVVFSIGSTLEANDNGTDGVLLLQYGAVELIGVRLGAHGNAGDGITVREQSTLTLGIAEFGVERTVAAQGNEGHGMSVLDGSLVVVDGIMPVTSRENLGSGLVVDAGSTANIRGSTFADNAEPDVERFAARATLNDNIIGEFVCDEISFSRGSDVCPYRVRLGSHLGVPNTCTQYSPVRATPISRKSGCMRLRQWPGLSSHPANVSSGVMT